MRTFQGKIRRIKYRFCQSLFFLLLFFNSSHLRLNASPRSLKFFFLIANQKIANPPIPANSNVPITIPAICPPESPSFLAGGVISPLPEDLSSYTAVAFFRFIRTKSERFCSSSLNFVVATVFRLVFYALQCIRKFAHMVFSIDIITACFDDCRRCSVFSYRICCKSRACKYNAEHKHKTYHKKRHR